MDPFAKIVDCIQPLTIFENHFILFVSKGYEYASDKTKQNPGLGLQSLHFFFLNSILSSHYYPAVTLNTYNINQRLFTRSNSSQLLVTSAVKVRKSKINSQYFSINILEMSLSSISRCYVVF